MSASEVARGVEAVALRRLELFADLSDERLDGSQRTDGAKASRGLPAA